MKKTALIVVALLALGGCAGTTEKEAAKPAAEAAKPGQISAEAQAALDKAKADVKRAGDEDGLWTTAADSLKAAEEAAKKGDSAAVLKNAKKASEHVEIGLKQTKYPLTHL